jgi:GNAT superfamily N-acetyltransferase
MPSNRSALWGVLVGPAAYEPIIGKAVRNSRSTCGHGSAFDSGCRTVLCSWRSTTTKLFGVAEVGRGTAASVIWKRDVKPERRGRGIGRALLRAAISEAPREVSRVLLEHFTGNERAAAFYELEGFEHLHTEPAASGDPAAATCGSLFSGPGGYAVRRLLRRWRERPQRPGTRSALWAGQRWGVHPPAVRVSGVLFVYELGDSHGSTPTSMRTGRTCSYVTTRDSPSSSTLHCRCRGENRYRGRRTLGGQ